MTVRRVILLLATMLPVVLGAIARAADIEVKVVHFGAGDVARGAGAFAVQCEFRSALERVVEIEAVLELPNADLDIAEHSRSFVLNPGQAQRRWLYGYLPPMGEGTLQTSIFELRLYELEGGRRVRDLGTAQVAPQVAENAPRVLAPEEDAFLVVGARGAGLDIYAQVPNGVSTIPSMNLSTAIANVREVESFPDRWEGFAPFSTVAWVSGAVVPSRLSEESARALLEWTERGGNLVIALPAAGDPWGVGVAGRHGLSEVLPSKAPTRTDDVPVAELLPILSVDPVLRAPNAKIRLATFDAATLDRGWRPFMALPCRRSPKGELEPREGSLDGALVAIRREYGFGHITLLGLDVDELASRALQNPSIPQGDVFWNRIVGRRADTPSGAEYAALSDANRLSTRGGYARTIGEGDEASRVISLTGQAAVGALAATAVFAAYWLVAGPLGFALLKRARRERWAWVAYVVVAAVFTAGIWVVGDALAGRSARIRHMTVLDMVERAPGESDVTRPQPKRATGWLSLFVPQYGATTVALDPEGEKGVRNTLASWRASTSDAEGFPNRERYRMPVDSPASIELPARSTAIDLESRWLGPIGERWGRLPFPSKPVRATVTRGESALTISVEGELQHQLPAALNDVVVVHVWPARNPLPALGPDRPPTRIFPGQLPNRGVMRSIARWNPGTALDLSEVLPTASLNDRAQLDRDFRTTYYDPLYKSLSQFGGIGPLTQDPIAVARVLPMLSMYGMLTPPDYLQNPPSSPEVLRVSRADMRELDLSCWLTQPCLIVMGTLDEVPLPYPLTVDGEEVESSGQVFVRWIMPLPDAVEWIVPDRVPMGTVRPGVRAVKDAAKPDDAGGSE